MGEADDRPASPDPVSGRTLDALVATYHEVLGPARKDSDAHREICECRACGRRMGWAVVHEGDFYREVGFQERPPSRCARRPPR